MTTRYFYGATFGSNGVEVDVYRFPNRRERDRWVGGGWGRCAKLAKTVPAGLDWADPEIYHSDETPVICEAAAL